MINVRITGSSWLWTLRSLPAIFSRLNDYEILIVQLVDIQDLCGDRALQADSTISSFFESASVHGKSAVQWLRDHPLTEGPSRCYRATAGDEAIAFFIAHHPSVVLLLAKTLIVSERRSQNTIASRSLTESM
jgi:hypothetical protein